MGAYAKAKELGREAVLEKIDSLGICETGVYREKMTDHLKAAEEAAAKEGEEQARKKLLLSFLRRKRNWQPPSGRKQLRTGLKCGMNSSTSAATPAMP